MLCSMSERVRQPPASVTLVYGPEPLLAERAVEATVGAARAADDGADVTDANGADLSAGLLAQQLSPSLFATRRVLIVREMQNTADDVGDALLAFAAAPEPDAHVILVHPGVVKGKKLLTALRKAGIHEIGAERVTRPDEQVDFVRAEVRAGGGRIDEDAARKLVDAIGADLRALAAAAGQLSSDAPDGVVTTDVVATYFEGHSEVKGWVVADRAIEGRTAQAIEQLRWAMETGTDAVLIVGALATSLRSLAMLSGMPRGVRDADIARELSVPPWKVRVLKGQLRGWRPDGLAAAIRAVATADLEVKGAGTDATLALTKAVVSVGTARSSQ
jgi:DNA polymerase-3 subunit delta